MKNMLKLIGILAILAILAMVGFAFVACDEGDGDGNGSFTLVGTTWYFAEGDATIKFVDEENFTHTFDGNTLNGTYIYTGGSTIIMGSMAFLSEDKKSFTLNGDVYIKQ